MHKVDYQEKSRFKMIFLLKFFIKIYYKTYMYVCVCFAFKMLNE